MTDGSNPPKQPRGADANAALLEVVLRNRVSGQGGVYAVCSAHPWVIDAAIQQASENDAVLHVESTSSQVNQLGGYTGQTPAQFAQSVYAAAGRMGFSRDRILLGGDHLGPFPWKDSASEGALQKAAELVRACVLAGYAKIHLDASMACADDPKLLPESVVAQRTALLCQVAEKAWQDLPRGVAPPLYVIGTEVPAPGGEAASGAPPAVTSVESLHQTLRTFQAAFNNKGLSQAWQRVIGVVVQPGVEFGHDVVFDYDSNKARFLSKALPASPELVYEAHSTDYQSASALARMVQDHFAILKVGPWLTFAFREAVFALSAIEKELLAGSKGRELSHVREALDRAMLLEPSYWRPYYQGDDSEMRLSRAYSYSDRCRYYWPVPAVQTQIECLLNKLSTHSLPMTLLSQYLPQEYTAIRAGKIEAQPGAIIQYHIRLVLRTYAAACGMANSISHT